MNKRGPIFIVIVACLSASILLSLLVLRVFSYPYPQIKIAANSKYAVIDMCGVMFGARRLAADIAWVELLQYYGSPERPLDKDTEFDLSWDMTKYLFGIPLVKDGGRGAVGDKKPKQEHHTDFNAGKYADLYQNTLRVTELDPFFSYAFLYGAGALAWNLDRPEEAIKLLKAGIVSVERFSPDISKDVHHPFWQYHLYLSAIIYKKAGKFTEMTTLLETAVKQPECPNMVKAILANIYQKEGVEIKALKLWFEIYDSNDPTYSAKAAQKISELKSFAGI